MLPFPYFIVLSLLLVVAAVWCYHILRRLPRDLAEVYLKYKRYTTRFDPDVLETMEKEERRLLYQRQCVTDFWTTLAVYGLVLWPVTLACIVFMDASGAGYSLG